MDIPMVIDMKIFFLYWFHYKDIWYTNEHELSFYILNLSINGPFQNKIVPPPPVDDINSGKAQYSYEMTLK